MADATNGSQRKTRGLQNSGISPHQSGGKCRALEQMARVEVGRRDYFDVDLRL